MTISRFWNSDIYQNTKKKNILFNENIWRYNRVLTCNRMYTFLVVLIEPISIHWIHLQLFHFFCLQLIISFYYAYSWLGCYATLSTVISCCSIALNSKSLCIYVTHQLEPRDHMSILSLWHLLWYYFYLFF